MLIRAFIVLLALGIAALVWRWRCGRRHPVLLALLALGLTWSTYNEGRMVLLERDLSRIASKLVGEPVRVHCQRGLKDLVDVTGNAGYVPYPADGAQPDETFLRKDTCESIASYRQHPNDPSSITEVVGVHVLTHEVAHLRGIRDESLAECQAMQRDAQTAQLLGADEEVAARLAGAYYRSVYPSMPPLYVDPECRRSGALDERLPGSPWD